MSKLYIIRDTLAQAPAGPLVVLEHDAVAIRMFREILAEPQSMVARFVGDHALLCLGDFDKSSCLVTPYADSPRVVVDGNTMKAIMEAEKAERQEAATV